MVKDNKRAGETNRKSMPLNKIKQRSSDSRASIK